MDASFFVEPPTMEVDADMSDLKIEDSRENVSFQDNTSSASDITAQEEIQLANIMRKDSASPHPELEIVGEEEYDVEVPPEVLTYRTVGSSGLTFGKRPSISDLLYGRQSKVFERKTSRAEANDEILEAKKKEVELIESMRAFGMWDGVFARNLSNIFGVIMFLRLGYCFGEAGIGYGVLVVLLSGVVTLLTAISLSAICSNGEVLEGGAYLMISRSLGPKFGGSIGILFSLANAVAVALYLVGFAETLVQQMGEVFGGTWDLRLWGLISLFVIFIMCLIGAGWIVKLSLAMLGVLILSIISVIIGVFFSPEDESKGFHGVSSELFSENFGPIWKDGNFFYVLSIFFPAVTGIMAGANISGLIKDAGKNIPNGTILSVVVTSMVYVLLGVLMAASTKREADGGGLLEDSLIMTTQSIWGPIIYVGIYVATLNAAIASLMGAPRILYRVACDNLFPILKPFSKLHEGKYIGQNEPWNGYLLTFCIAGGCILIGDLNAIAPLITGFFIISYAFVNFACFAASYTKSPGWRPTFKYYNKWVALVTALICIALLFLVNVVFGAATLLIGAALFKYVEYTDPDVNWGSAIEAGKYLDAMNALTKLEWCKVHVKNYRPQILVFCESLIDNPELVLFAQQLRKSQGVIIYGSVINSNFEDLKNPDLFDAHKVFLNSRNTSPIMEFQKKYKVVLRNAFYENVISPSLHEGCRYLIQLAGVGKIRPNSIMLGFKENWKKNLEVTDHYVGVIRDAFFLKCAVMIVRGTKDLVEIDQDDLDEKDEKDESMHSVVSVPTQYHFMREHKKTVDVWWLYDDGGFTILVPYLLRMHRKWRHSHIRVMNVNINQKTGNDLVSLANLLHKFRIKAEIVSVNLKVSKGRKVDSVSPHILEKFNRCMSEYNKEKFDEEKKHIFSERCKRHLKIAELIHEKSKDADIIICTMPVPEVSLNTGEFMSWLDVMSHPPLPPFVFIRGNQETVLTFDM